MGSKYDSIDTAKDLITEVRAHGLSLASEDICRAQDIFGHTPLDELAFLANDIGRDNEKGEPDPKGSLCSGRPGTRAIFYQILFNIWHWEQATEFYNKYTLEIPAQIADLKKQIEASEHDGKAAKKRADEMEAKAAECYKRFREMEDAGIKLTNRLKERDRQIVELKAKLYDLLEEKAETEELLARNREELDKLRGE